MHFIHHYVITVSRVASGSFDRTVEDVKLWNFSRASQPTTTTPNPIMTLTPPDLSGTNASIYALAVDPQGHIITSGSLALSESSGYDIPGGKAYWVLGNWSGTLIIYAQFLYQRIPDVCVLNTSLLTSCPDVILVAAYRFC